MIRIFILLLIIDFPALLQLSPVFVYGQLKTDNINSSSTPDITSTYTRNWKGLNPFFQPYNTTDYYGSGDINGDGKMTNDDFHLIQKIISGEMTPNIRADVNGDKYISETDASLILESLNGRILPGWWNQLANKEAKISWIKKMLSLDTTDTHSYISGKYECWNFAAQLYYNFTGYNEFSVNLYSFQTIYNLPLMIAFMTMSSGETHYANAILVDENPLSFSSWLFIEPQTDSIISPGVNFNKPGTDLALMLIKDNIKVTFTLEQTGDWKLGQYDNEMVKLKPLQQPLVNNLPFCWNPKYLKNGNVLFERAADNLSRNYSIHIASLHSLDQPGISMGKQLIGTNIPNRVIFTKQNHKEYTHLIWEENGNERKYYYGQLNAAGTGMHFIQELSFLKEVRFSNIRILEDKDRTILFWLDFQSDRAKIIFSEMIDTLFQDPREYSFEQQNPISLFEVVSDSSGTLKFYCAFNSSSDLHKDILYYSFDGEMSSPVIIEKGVYRPQRIVSMDNNLFILQQNKIFYYLPPFDIQTYFGWLATLGNVSQIEETGYPGMYYLLGLYMVAPGTYNYYLYIVKDLYYTEKRYQPFNVDYNSTNPNGLINDGKITIVWQSVSNRNSVIKYTVEDMNITGVTKDTDNKINLDLHQNFPNPFNTSTVLSYRLDEEGQVSLKIYDLLGREITTLIKEHKEPGNYTVDFNAANFSSGVYIYQLKTRTKSISKKMLLMK